MEKGWRIVLSITGLSVCLVILITACAKKPMGSPSAAETKPIEQIDLQEAGSVIESAVAQQAETQPPSQLALREAGSVIESAVAQRVEPQGVAVSESAPSQTKTAREVAVSQPGEEYHIVKKGECLWWIAEYEDIYSDPFMWPIIYDANKEIIKDPDLIYPDQAFRIPRSGYTIEEIKEARRSAGAPKPYMPPAHAAKLPVNP